MTIRREEGTAAIEFVLIAPALLLLLAVIVGSGRVVSTKSAVLTVAREAARSASAEPDASSALAVAKARANEIAEGLGLSTDRLIVEQEPGSFERGTPYMVRVAYRVELSDLPAFGFLPGSFIVSARHAELTDRYKSR